MRITVVVVTYDSAAVLPAMLTALPAAFDGDGPAELVVVDNDSHDDTLAIVERLAPDATVVRMGRNAGYAAGLNAGVRAARPSEAVLLLNPDTRPRPGSVAPLARALDRPGVAVSVPRLVAPDGTTARSLRRDPTVLRALAAALVGGRRAGRFAATGEVVHDPARYEHEGPVDWSTGAAMLLDRAVLARLGGWDESFFLYSEETDYALRVRDAGGCVWYVREAVMEHIGGDAPTSPALWALLTANRVCLYRRRHGPVRAAAFHGAVLLNEALRWRRPTHRAALRALRRPADVAQSWGRGSSGP